MTPRDMALAAAVAVIWGVAFVVSKVGLDTFTPAQLTTLRFTVAALAIIVLPRPAVSWPMLIWIGSTIFAGQFLLQFFGMAMGMPAGLTAVVSQMQAVFTVVLAAVFLGDRPGIQQIIGICIALIGLALIALGVGEGASALGFSLALASAMSWALGNVAVKTLPKVNMTHLMVWASLIPPLPAFIISVLVDGPYALISVLAAAPLHTLLAPLYLGLIASILAYAIWGRLLQQYTSGLVAPFALLAPCVGAIVSAWVFEERFPPLRLAGIVLILIGVAAAVLPARWISRHAATQRR